MKVGDVISLDHEFKSDSGQLFIPNVYKIANIDDEAGIFWLTMSTPFGTAMLGLNELDFLLHFKLGGEILPFGNQPALKCECGVGILGEGKHSTWCQMNEIES